jgi:hypothetical protein
MGWLLSLVSGPLLGAALAAYRARLTAAGSSDQRALELLQKEIEAEIAARAEASRLLRVEQGRWYTAMVRPLFALPFVIFAGKVVVWDKVFGFGTTDPLDPQMWGVFNVIVVSYFGASAVERVARIFQRR